ncbi:MAG: M20 family metallopeptidase [Vicingaceae bacterium]
MDLKSKIKSLAADFYEEIVDIRRHLHQNPELSFQEYNTSKYICSVLDAMNISYKTGYVNTGIVAHIKGKNPDKKVIALRADIDALPINEQNELEYKSSKEGVMHACGHDVHTSSLLGTAKILNQLTSEFEGTVKLIFQPGEEKLPGGASLMIKEGALENPKANAIIGQHVFPDLEVGKVGFRKGMYMASADEIYVTVKGKGGHAALPHKYNNPLIIASDLLLSLQEVFMKNTKGLVPDNVPSVLAFGKIKGEGATNVIPNEVLIEGTFRTMNEEWRKKAHQIMRDLANETAQKYNASIDFDIQVGYPFLVNDENLTGQCISFAEEYVGKENVVTLDLRMTAEDFAYYSQLMPACFYRLGTRNEAKNITHGLHTPFFNIDEEALRTSTGLMAWLTIKALNS